MIDQDSEDPRRPRLRIWHLLLIVLVVALFAAMARTPRGSFLAACLASAVALLGANRLCLGLLDRATKWNFTAPGLSALLYMVLLSGIVVSTIALVVLLLFLMAYFLLLMR